MFLLGDGDLLNDPILASMELDSDQTDRLGDWKMLGKVLLYRFSPRALEPHCVRHMPMRHSLTGVNSHHRSDDQFSRGLKAKTASLSSCVHWNLQFQYLSIYRSNYHLVHWFLKPALYMKDLR